MRKYSIAFVVLLVVVFSGFANAQTASDVLKPELGAKLGSCSMCGMDVFEKMLTRTDLVRGDSTDHACSLMCAAAMAKETRYDSIQVHECDSLHTIPAMDAYYLFGSRMVPARAMLAVLVFGSKESAESFQHKNGGTVYRGQAAFDAAYAIRLERIEARKKSAEKGH